MIDEHTGYTPPLNAMCQDCRGTGSVLVPSGFTKPNGDGNGLLVEHSCRPCDGTGWFPIGSARLT